jgi:hypothetical protein
MFIFSNSGSRPDANRQFKFEIRRQLFIGVHDKTLSVAMGAGNPDYSPIAMHC